MLLPQQQQRRYFNNRICGRTKDIVAAGGRLAEPRGDLSSGACWPLDLAARNGSDGYAALPIPIRETQLH
jgi:hypothetical protein